MDRKTELRQRLEETRSRTLWLLDQVPDEFLRVRVHSFYSPIGWHFGHVGRTEEYWICQATGTNPYDERLSFLYADLPDNPKDNRVHIPDRQGVQEYLATTRQRVFDALDVANLDTGNPLLAEGYGWEFAIQHECQHQETIAEMLQLIQMKRPQPLVEPVSWQGSVSDQWIKVAGGSFTMGHSDRHRYDNEKQPHEVRVGGFQVARFPVTAYAWSRFMEDGGYERPELWTDVGWQWRQDEEVGVPEYWIRRPEGFAFYGPFGVRAVHPDEPVSSVSKHEADAFAKWAGKRLLSEPEWEYLATSPGSRNFAWGDEAPDETRACFGLKSWAPLPAGTRPRGANAFGVEELAGNVWEWTSSPFLPYPGFEPFPYDGYSKDHMRGAHFVCRGGSWATSPTILRSSFRNWYVPTYRQGFLGLRLANG